MGVNNSGGISALRFLCFYTDCPDNHRDIWKFNKERVHTARPLYAIINPSTRSRKVSSYKLRSAFSTDSLCEEKKNIIHKRNALVGILGFNPQLLIMHIAANRRRQGSSKVHRQGRSSAGLADVRASPPATQPTGSESAPATAQSYLHKAVI